MCSSYLAFRLNWLREKDSNLRLLGYEPSGLTTDVSRDWFIYIETHSMLGEQFIELSNHQRVRSAFVYKVAD